MAKKGGDAPEAPDLTGIEKQFKKSSKRAWRLANQHLKWAKKQSRKDWDRTKPIMHNLKRIMRDQRHNAREDRARYEEVFVPYEDQYMGEIEGLQGKVDTFSATVDKLKQDALNYGSEANKHFMAGRAIAGVTGAFDAAKNNSIRTLEAAGVNPGATRMAALTYGLDAAEAAAKAAAGTQAGLNVDETSRAMYQEALDREVQALGLDKDVMGFRTGVVELGRGLAGQAIAEGNAAGAAGDVMGRTKIALSELANRQRLGSNDFLRTLTDGLSNWGNMLNQRYQTETQAYQAEQQASSGIGGLFGTILGGIRGFLEEGGEVPEEWSMSDGAIADDVPVNLTVGEFVFPKEAVDFYGADKLYKMRDKAVQGMLDYETADEAIAT